MEVLPIADHLSRTSYIISDFFVVIQDQKQAVHVRRNFGSGDRGSDRNSFCFVNWAFSSRHCFDKDSASFVPHICESKHSFAGDETVRVVYNVLQLWYRGVSARPKQPECRLAVVVMGRLPPVEHAAGRG